MQRFDVESGQYFTSKIRQDYTSSSPVHRGHGEIVARRLLPGSGLEPQDDNPRFHQQMLYAVTMKVIANFERAVGRRLEFERFPHAFRDRNAFFDPTTNLLSFGYFQADPRKPGENLPSQWIKTPADRAASLLRHAYVLTMANCHVLLDCPMLDIPSVERARGWVS